MEARPFSYASATWKSILGSRWILENGLRWRIGDGRSVRIWEDNWLPRDRGCRVISPPHLLEPDSFVSELIVHGTRLWNASMIDSVFNQAEAKLIKSIPLGSVSREDSLFWPFKKNGVYTVKSGYIFAKSRSEEAQAGSSSSHSSGSEFGWKNLWRIKVPEKIKVFGWRAIKGTLPTCDNLQKKKVVCDPLCQSCNENEESILHCLRDCHVARQSWLLSPLGLRSGISGAENVGDWWADLFKQVDMEGKAWVVVLAWSLWNNRNDTRFNSKKLRPVDIVNRAASLLKELRDLQVSKLKRVCLWSCPPRDCVKVNVDGAFFADGQWGCTAVVIRDHLGFFIAAKAQRVDFAFDVDCVEAMAMLMGLELALELGYTCVQVEGDPKAVCDLVIADQELLFSQVGVIVEDVKRSEEFGSITFSHVLREANMVAHALTRTVIETRENVWLDKAPLVISALTVADLSSS